MAQRKIKIALSSSLPNIAAIAAMWVDNDQLEFGLDVPNTIDNPHVSEYTFEATGTHILKVAMVNDYFDGIEDLNLMINYVALANEDGTYPEYTYLSFNPAIIIRTTDYNYLLTYTIWSAGDSVELAFNVNGPITWYDQYKYDLDNATS